ncbi:pilus assembly protein PilW [Acinetobacter sp. TTH0-4]|uniref:PilW family protein n=1 Tax=Acinetobacter sp. TTH0-4 TaxID=1646498 RepID=UPI0006AFE3D0|nr:PilW family protein [Acinetobacter sp. TTH0-4]ALD03512.1 pilus assembly protein PilW [Acinetobacter sp. TTH0-4]
MPRNYASGFTLIELMIALTLGLIVVAAATLLLLTGQRSVAMQKGVVELQDNANFGLNYITKDIRLTNLNTRSAAINDATLYGGVVLTSNASTDAVIVSSVKKPNLPTTIVIDDALLSQSDDRAGWAGVSNVKDISGDLKSDQLVIQYLPQYTIDDKGTTTGATREADDEYVGGFDCEGNEIRYLKSLGLRMYVQRYFLREDSNKATNESSPLALACDAGYYLIGSSPTAITNLGGAGEIIMKRVDHFRVLLGAQSVDVDTSASTPVTSIEHQYVSIKDYMAMTPPRPRILSLQLGMLVRSTQSVGADAAVKADQEFQVLDQAVKVKTSTGPKYIRQVVSQTIALRNALGER